MSTCVRRSLRTIVPVVAAALALLSGCTAAGGGAATPATKPAAGNAAAATSSASPPPPVLRLVVSGGYVQDGSTNPGENWVSAFEVASGCQVELTNAVDDADAVRDITGHGNVYDGVLASPSVTGQLIAAKAVAPLRTARISGYGSIDAVLRSAPGERSGGAVYGLPYLWDAYTMGYRTDAVTPPGGWGALFAPASAASHAGKIMLPDSPDTLALAALYLRSSRPSLGITDPFELDKTQLAAAVGVLKAMRSSVGTFWSADGSVVGQLGDGQDVLGAVMTHQVGDLIRAGLKVGYVPAPAASTGGPTAARPVGYVESWLMSAHAPDRSCMYRWLSWMTSGYVQEHASVWSGLAPASPAGCYGSAAAICRLYHEKSLASGSTSNVVFDHLPVSGCGNGRTDCTSYAQWVTAWQQIVPSYIPGSGL